MGRTDWLSQALSSSHVCLRQPVQPPCFSASQLAQCQPQPAEQVCPGQDGAEDLGLWSERDPWRAVLGRKTKTTDERHYRWQQQPQLWPRLHLRTTRSCFWKEAKGLASTGYRINKWQLPRIPVSLTTQTNQWVQLLGYLLWENVYLDHF